MNANDAANRLEQAARQGETRLEGGQVYVPPPRMLIALKRFRLTQGPSSPDPVILICEGDQFTLDGDEPGISEEGLIRMGMAKRADYRG